MAVNPVDAMTWKARELKISYGILLTQITEEERQEILEGYEEMLQKKEAEHQERLRQKARLPKPPQKRPHQRRGGAGSAFRPAGIDCGSD